MACDEFEILILDYIEDQLPQGQRQRIETHLRGCADCRAFGDRLKRLDAALTRSIQPVGPSPDFNRRLQERIQAAPKLLSETEKAERKRRLQAEYEAGLARLPLRSLAADDFVNALGYVAVVAMAGWLAWWFAPRWIDLLNNCIWSLQDPNTILLFVVGAALSGLGFLATFQWRARRLWTAG